MSKINDNSENTFIQIFNCPPAKFANLDFTEKISTKCFMKMKKPKVNLGYLDETVRLCYMQNNVPTNKHFLIKIIKKKIIYKAFAQKEFLDIVYNCSSDYSIQLRNHWEEDSNLFLVFKDIGKFISLEDKLKKHTLSERTLFTYYNHILQAVSNLHKNQMFGCILGMSSFIYDQNERKVKLTDIGFSKIFPKKKSLNPYKLRNGFDFNEYLPSEYLLAKSDSPGNNDIPPDDKFVESYDVWQLGVLFFKMASNNNESPFPHENSTELYNAISKGSINFQCLNHRSSSLLQLIQKMLNPDSTKRSSISKLLEYVQNQIQQDKFVDDYGDWEMVNSSKAQIRSTLFRGTISPSKGNQNGSLNQKNEVSRVIYPYLNNSWSHSNLGGQINDISSVYEISDMFKSARNEKKMINEAKEEIEKMCDDIKGLINESRREEEDEKNELINMFQDLEFKNESIESFDLLLKSRKEISEQKYQDMIRRLVFEIKRLKINLDVEKSKNLKLKKKLDDVESKKKDLSQEYQEKLTFLESKVDVFENLIFPESTSDFDVELTPSFKTKAFTDLIAKSIKSFNEINKELSNQSAKLLETINEKINQFLIEKEGYVQEIIKAKENLMNEVIYLFNKNNINIESLEETSQKTKHELMLIQENNELEKNYNELFSKIKKITHDIKLNNEKENPKIIVNTNISSDLAVKNNNK